MKTIVVSFDPEAVAELLPRLAHWGWKTEWTGLEEACSQMRQPDPPSCVVLHEGPAGPPAEELLGGLRADCPTEALHVVVLTAGQASGRAAELIRLGADECLPAGDWETLELRLQVVRRIVGRYARAPHVDYRERALREAETGLFNRTAILDILETELHRAARQEMPVGLLLIGLASSELTREVTMAMSSCLRPYDSLGRHADEEFLAVLPGCGREGARAVAERLGARVRGLEAAPTLSVGVSCHHGASPAPISSHLDRARAALAWARRRPDGVAGTWEAPPEEGRPHVLVLDDSPPIRDLCARALQEIAEVGTFEGLRQAAPHMPWADVVVTDLQMPEYDGLAVLDYVRSRGLASPVLVMTGCDPQAWELAVLKAAAVPVLHKPFHVTRLQGEVRRLLGQRVRQD